jgi:hypothetical protein
MRTLFKLSVFTIFFIFSLFSLIFSQQEHLTITTYYPSPYGSYRVLRVEGATGAGPNPGIFFRRTDLAPAADHWFMGEEGDFFVIRDLTDPAAAGWWGVGIDRVNNRAYLGSFNWRIDSDGTIFWTKAAELMP